MEMKFKEGQRVEFIGFHINGKDPDEVFEYQNFQQEFEKELMGKQGVIQEVDESHGHPYTVNFTDNEDYETLLYWKETELKLVETEGN